MLNRFFGWLSVGIFLLTFNLGCMGVINGLTGLDLEMAIGEDAVHPADFPVPPIQGGTKQVSMAMSAPGTSVTIPGDFNVDIPTDPNHYYRIEVISYGHPDGAKVLEAMRESLTAAGWTTVSERPGDVYVFTKDQVIFVGGLEDGSVSLARVRPLPKNP